MHGHAHDHDADVDTAARPRAAHSDDRPDGVLWRAAAAGRSDVLGPAGLLRLQRAAGNSGAAAAVAQERSPVLDVVGSGGQPLEEPVRADMEARLGADFSDVRVHTDSGAHESAVAVGAHAYTVGRDVVFQRDAYDPASVSGQRTLAHELTHVVQQRQGPVDGTPTGDGVRVSDPSDRFEQEAAANAERVTAGPAPVAAGAPAGQGAAVQRAVDPAVQREAAEEQEEEPLQGAFVQRAQDAALQREEEEEEPAS